MVGLIILAHYIHILGLFLGIDLILAGAGWIGIGLGLKRRV
jgi:hypothetical protein